MGVASLMSPNHSMHPSRERLSPLTTLTQMAIRAQTPYNTPSSSIAIPLTTTQSYPPPSACLADQSRTSYPSCQAATSHIPPGVTPNPPERKEDSVSDWPHTPPNGTRLELSLRFISLTSTLWALMARAESPPLYTHSHLDTPSMLISDTSPSHHLKPIPINTPLPELPSMPTPPPSSVQPSTAPSFGLAPAVTDLIAPDQIQPRKWQPAPYNLATTNPDHASTSCCCPPLENPLHLL